MFPFGKQFIKKVVDKRILLKLSSEDQEIIKISALLS